MQKTVLTMLMALVAGAAFLAQPAPALANHDEGRDDYYDALNGYDYTIGGLGDRFDGWDSCDTRVYVKVRDNRYGSNQLWFDSLPAAYFVLRERYGHPDLVELAVPEYGGHGRNGGLIDGQYAYYVWDWQRHSPGGLPLVLAFDNYDDAWSANRDCNGELADFNGVLNLLSNWYGDNRDRCYWRGWDNSGWTADRWNGAWNHRWDGYGWDHDRGWIDLHFKVGGVDVNVGASDRDSRNRNRGRHDDGRHYNGNGGGGNYYNDSRGNYYDGEGRHADDDNDRARRDRENDQRRRDEEARQRDEERRQREEEQRKRDEQQRHKERDRQRDYKGNGHDNDNGGQGSGDGSGKYHREKGREKNK